MTRGVVTVWKDGTTHTFKQGRHESSDEFHGRATAYLQLEEGDEYIWWEDYCPGPPSPYRHGTKHRVVEGKSVRLPSLFVLVGGVPYDYREAPDDRYPS